MDVTKEKHVVKEKGEGNVRIVKEGKKLKRMGGRWWGWWGGGGGNVRVFVLERGSGIFVSFGGGRERGKGGIVKGGII